VNPGKWVREFIFLIRFEDKRAYFSGITSGLKLIAGAKFDHFVSLMEREHKDKDLGLLTVGSLGQFSRIAKCSTGNNVFSTARKYLSGRLRGIVPSGCVDVDDLETSKSGVVVRLNEIDAGSPALRY
jgi:hypothetical protein